MLFQMEPDQGRVASLHRHFEALEEALHLFRGDIFFVSLSILVARQCMASFTKNR